MQQACKNLKGINELYRQLKDYFDKFLISFRKFETDEDSRLHNKKHIEWILKEIELWMMGIHKTSNRRKDLQSNNSKTIVECYH